jgi:hypothetical protein
MQSLWWCWTKRQWSQGRRPWPQRQWSIQRRLLCWQQHHPLQMQRLQQMPWQGWQPGLYQAQPQRQRLMPLVPPLVLLLLKGLRPLALQWQLSLRVA